MDLRQLRCFVAVARYANFTRAAEHLGIAQPAVSMSIRKLEEALELTLFNRVDKKVSLTAEGEILLAHAHKILALVQAAELEMRELKQLVKGEVRIGIPSMLGSYYFPPILMAFKHRYPQLRLSVIEAGTRQLQQMIHRGELDMGVIVRDDLPDDLEARRFLREEMVACVPEDHPFAAQTAISYDAFFNEELVLFKEGYFHREFIKRISSRIGATPKVAFETNLIPLIKSIVQQGFGITTFLRRVVSDAPTLRAVPFQQPVYLDLCIAWKREGYLSRANRAFVEFLLEQAGAAAEPLALP